MKQKTIWFFHHYATPLTMSGMGRPAKFSRHLQEAGLRVTVFAASFLHYSSENLINNNQLYVKNTETETPFVFVKTRSYVNSGKARIINMFQFYWNLRKTVKELLKNGTEKPDVIIASSPHPLTMIAGIKIAKRLNVPCICEVRDFWPEVFFFGGRLKEKSLIGRLLVAGEHWIYRNADAMIFLKEGDITYITDHHWEKDVSLKKCHYINNGIDYYEFRDTIQTSEIHDTDLESDLFKIIYVGAIRPVNNIDMVLDAAKELASEKDIVFLIYGNGNMLPHLQERIATERITNVKLKGYVPKSSVPYILSKASVNLLNYSSKEYNWSRGNSSNKLFEYMASGKPILSNVKMGYCLLKKYHCGISVENDSLEEYVRCIRYIKSMSSETYEELCQNALKAAKLFDYRKLTNDLLQVINSVCSDS